MANSDAVSRGDLIVELADIHLKLASAAGPVNILRGIDLSIDVGDHVSMHDELASVGLAVEAEVVHLDPAQRFRTDRAAGFPRRSELGGGDGFDGGG